MTAAERIARVRGYQPPAPVAPRQPRRSTPVAADPMHPAAEQILGVLDDYAVTAEQVPEVLRQVAAAYRLTASVRAARPPRPATCTRGHEWTPETTGHRRDGSRYCLTCRADRDAVSARRCRNGHVKDEDWRDHLGRRWCPECKGLMSYRGSA